MSPDGTDADMYPYDDFHLAAASTVTDVTWRGSDAAAGNVSSFTIRFYNSLAGGSQPVITALPTEEKASDYLKGYSLSLAEANRTAIGSTGVFEYHYHLPTSLSLLGGTPYWIKIEAAANGYGGWGLTNGTNGNGNHITYYTGGPYFLRAGGDTAFKLSGTTAAPEPASLSVIGVGMFLVGARRRRKAVQIS